jgi:hypothetical protein
VERVPYGTPTQKCMHIIEIFEWFLVRVPYDTPTQKSMEFVYLNKHINLMILIIKG